MSAQADTTPTPPISVLRVYHSGVVTRWRERNRWLRRLGARVVTVSPRRWNEGGRDVDVAPEPGEPLVIARTLGRHPYRFVYDPIPILRLLRRERFDVIDIHEEPASLAAAEVQLLAWLARQGQVPFCLYSAQNIPKRYPPPFRWLEQVALRRAAAVHSCNDAVTQILRDKGFTGAVCNLGLGVDPVLSDSRTAARSGRFVVGYVGRLEEYKGVQVLLDAAAEVGDVQVVLVGDGPHRPQLESQVRRLGLDDRVDLVGFAGPEDVQSRYRAFDVVVVPSVERPNWIEQFGRVPVEAMSAGVPVIASDSGSLPEVLADAGILVPPEDAAALATAIRAVRDVPSRREELAQRGRARADHFTWRSIAERHVELYESIGSTRSRPRSDPQIGSLASKAGGREPGSGEFMPSSRKIGSLRDGFRSARSRKERVDLVAKRFGVHVEPRYHRLEAHRAAVLQAHGVEIVIDVGANVGQYAIALRASGYQGWIESFEANPGVLAQLQAASAHDPRWTIHPVALGPTETTAKFFVTEQSPSSSLLGPIDENTPDFMAGEWSVDVPVRTLDSFAFWRRDRPLFLKLDIQGYELEALKGSVETLERCVGVESELSLIPLYADQALIEDVTAFLRARGFDPRCFVRGYTDPTSHVVVQMDGIYERRAPAAAPPTP